MGYAERKSGCKSPQVDERNGERKSIPADAASETRVKAAKKWSPTLPSTPPPPDPMSEAYAALEEARQALASAMLALDRVKRR